MNCEEARLLLDAYIDGELSENELRALRDHAQSCEACMRELEAAELLRDTLAHIDDDVVVPIEAQAAWRGAVRAEAAAGRKKTQRRWMRAAYAVAAALVLAVGGSVLLRGMSSDGADSDAMVMNLAADTPSIAAELVARDGGGEQAAYSGKIRSDYYSAWKKISTDAPVEAVETLEMLAAEYSGSCAMDGADICRIELPYEYMEDFLNAASRVGTELFFEIMDEEAQTAVIMIQLCAE